MPPHLKKEVYVVDLKFCDVTKSSVEIPFPNTSLKSIIFICLLKRLSL